MKLEYNTANHLLINEFPEMKPLYYAEENYYHDLLYCFYEGEFVPYIMKQLRQGDKQTLEKIWRFVERLFAEGDDGLVNLAGVAIVESLYFEKDFDSLKEIIFSYCGELTKQSFIDCIEYVPA